MIRLYYWPGYCSLATHIVLNWLGEDFELVKAGKTVRQSTTFAALNPSRTVPVLVEGDFVLSQNVAVLTYLADTHPDSLLRGGDSPKARALVNRWLGYVNSDFHKAFSPLHHPERKTTAQAISNVRGHLEIVNATLADRRWLAGDHRSVADPYLFVLLRWAEHFEIDMHDLAHVRRYHGEMLADPDVLRSLAEEKSGKRAIV